MSLVDELGARPQWRSLKLRTIRQLVRVGACGVQQICTLPSVDRHATSSPPLIGNFPRRAGPALHYRSTRHRRRRRSCVELAGRVGPCSPLGLWSLVLWTRGAGTPRLTSLQIPPACSALVSRASTVRETTCVTNFHESYR